MKLVFVHGSGGCKEGWYYQEKYFAGSDAVSLPGHPEGKPCTSIEGYVEWLRGYCKGRGYREVVLAGHSMGGAIAQLYGLHYPEELKALILISTGARLRVHPMYLEECQKAIQNPTPWIKGMEANYARVEPQVVKLIIEKRKQVGPAVQHNDFLCCDRFDFLDKVSQIRLPTLVLGGTEDVMTPLKFTQFLGQKIPGAKLVVFEGATHALPQERPREVNQTIGEFLKTLA